MSNEWTSAMFPLSPDGYQAERCVVAGLGIDCTVLGNTTVQIGMLNDLDAAFSEVNGQDASVERVIAMVPAGYFPYHGFPSIIGGVTSPGFGGDVTSLVSAPKTAGVMIPGVAIPVVAHEIAHQILPLGWNQGFDHYGFPAGAPPAVAPLGYLVGCCEIPSDAQNLMEGSLTNEPPHVWIDQLIYAEILPAVLILPDPAILLITGRETREGKILVRTMLDLPSGLPSRPRAGDHFIDLLDEDGHVLSTTSVTAPFKMIMDAPVGTIDIDEQPITIKLAYPPETARIRWRIMDRVLHEMDPVPQTLRTAVEGLPDRAFAKNPDQRRKALLAKIDAFGKLLEQKSLQGALEKLRNDLFTKAEEWVIDFAIDGAGQMDKSQLLALLARVEARVEARALASSHEPHDDDDPDEHDE